MNNCVVKIYDPTGKLLSPEEIANWANKVHNMAGGKGNPFTADMYACPESRDYRLKKDMCYCDLKETVEKKPTKGVFDLFPLSDRTVVSSGKAYMKCRNCGAYTHL